MYTLNVRNVNRAAHWGIHHLLKDGIEEDSRNGKVLVAPEPVTTTYTNPRERMLFGSERDANPFFHLMEALWMLSGRNDLAWPVQFNKRFSDYSDDQKIVFGAYGWRWRDFFGYDQLHKIIAELRKNPASRRCVLSMWNAHEDYNYEDDNVPLLSHSDLYVATHGGKDVPCNTHAYFDVRFGALNMTVCNRSNDVIWGAYGANVVHFSLLQEYIAEQIGKPVGVYRQISNNYHAYLDVYPRAKLLTIADQAVSQDMYNLWPALTKPYALGSTDPHWEQDLEMFLDTGNVDYNRLSFFSQVAGPMHAAWFARKNSRIDLAMKFLTDMPACDWKLAALDWMKRRANNNLAA